MTADRLHLSGVYTCVPLLLTVLRTCTQYMYAIPVRACKHRIKRHYMVNGRSSTNHNVLKIEMYFAADVMCT